MHQNEEQNIALTTPFYSSVNLVRYDDRHTPVHPSQLSPTVLKALRNAGDKKLNRVPMSLCEKSSIAAQKTRDGRVGMRPIATLDEASEYERELEKEWGYSRYTPLGYGYGQDPLFPRCYLPK